jgi:uncharacterized membrane protein
MKPLAILGIVLMLAGIGGLVFRSVHWTETEKVVDVGPIEVNAEKQHSVWIPTAAGIAAVLAGLGLVVVSRKNA